MSNGSKSESDLSLSHISVYLYISLCTLRTVWFGPFRSVSVQWQRRDEMGFTHSSELISSTFCLPAYTNVHMHPFDCIGRFTKYFWFVVFALFYFALLGFCLVFIWPLMLAVSSFALIHFTIVVVVVVVVVLNFTLLHTNHASIEADSCRFHFKVHTQTQLANRLQKNCVLVRVLMSVLAHAAHIKHI